MLPGRVIDGAPRARPHAGRSPGFGWRRPRPGALAGAPPRARSPRWSAGWSSAPLPRTRRLAIARIDFLVSDRPAALELNATIPAMPGYSDMAAGAFLSVVGRAAGLDAGRAPRLEAENGSNVEALHRALVAASVQERGRPPERIAVLCRRNDSQLSEVDHLVTPLRRARDRGPPRLPGRGEAATSSSPRTGRRSTSCTATSSSTA